MKLIEFINEVERFSQRTGEMVIEGVDFKENNQSEVVVDVNVNFLKIFGEEFPEVNVDAMLRELIKSAVDHLKESEDIED